MHQRKKAATEKRARVVRAFLQMCALASCLAATAAACTRAHAKTAPESPPLEMPASPPREVEPTDVEMPQPMPLQQEPARNAPVRPRPTPPQNQPRIEPPKAEPPKAEPPPTEPPRTEEPQRPPPLLQTTPATAEGEMERAIRATLTRASTNLNRVDAAKLTTDARTRVRHGEEFHSSGRRGRPRKEPRLCPKPRRQGGRAGSSTSAQVNEPQDRAGRRPAPIYPAFEERYTVHRRRPEV